MVKPLEKMGLVCVWALAVTGLGVQALAECYTPQEQAVLTLSSVTVNGEALAGLDGYANVTYSLTASYQGLTLYADGYAETFRVRGEP